MSLDKWGTDGLKHIKNGPFVLPDLIAPIFEGGVGQ
jgi:hypothetical protein